MKKFMFLFILGLIQVLFMNRADAQACCVDKTSCLKVTGMISSVKQDESQPSVTDQAKPAACQAVSATSNAVVSPVRMYTASYVFSQFGALASKIADKIKSNDPCCVAKGCDPTACDVSQCKPAQCNGSSMAKN